MDKKFSLMPIPYYRRSPLPWHIGKFMRQLLKDNNEYTIYYDKTTPHELISQLVWIDNQGNLTNQPTINPPFGRYAGKGVVVRKAF